MTEICEKEHCTGCWACVNSCMKNAITMREGQLGHLYPHIDIDICIDCRLCHKICPANKVLDATFPSTAFAGWSKNLDEYKTSTSGGAAAAFSKYLIRQGGVVYGCACLDNVNICHVRVDKESDLHLFKGSKYVQSNVGENFRLAKEDLQAGRKVLFIGTPCQIAGLKSYLRKDYANLYLVDLICHGVPSLVYLKQHVFKMTKSKEISQVKFRDGDGMYLLLLLLRDKVLYRRSLWEERYKDTYFNTFIDGFTYRNSCYQCKFAKPERVSDITIGDFWGLKDDLPLAHPNGCSCLLPITPKGVELINAIKSDFHLFEREISEAESGNEQLRHPKRKNFRISVFRNIYHLIGIDTAYKLTVSDRIIRYYLRKLIKKIFK